MSSEWSDAINKIDKDVLNLSRFHVRFWTEKDFIPFITSLGRHFDTYRYLWFLGYFDNSFAKKVEEHYWESRRELIDVRALSLPFRKDSRGQINKRTLEKLQRLHVEVKINDHLHGRMMLLLPDMGTISEVVLGSFDFNKDSLSGDKTNTGIHTNHPDIIKSAKTLYEEIWDSDDSRSLEDYTKDW